MGFKGAATYSADSEELEFNIELDGCPLGGLKHWKCAKNALFR